MQARGPRLTVLSLLAGALALALGFAGYRSLPADLGVGAALYRSIQLFFLDYQGPTTGIPWELEVARFLAAAVVLLAALGVIFTLAREQIQRLRVRAWTRPHVVVAGLGATGIKIALGLRQAGTRVVAIELSGAGRSSGARAAGIPVFAGDARSAAILDTARLQVAKDLIVVTGDDSVSLEVLASGHRILRCHREARAAIHVTIDDLALWQQLHRLALARERPSPRVEFVSLVDRAAEVLVSGASSALPSETGSDRILMYGCGGTATRAVIHAIRRSLLAGNTPTVVLRGPAADAVRDELRRTAPWAEKTGGICLQTDPEASKPSTAPTVALVCGFADAQALAAGVELAAESDGSRAEVFVAVPDQDTADALAATELRFDALTFVPTEPDVLGSGLLEGSASEMIARAKHEDYVLHERVRRIDRDSNPSMAPWSDLPEALRESNRRFAESIGSKLGELGASLVPLQKSLPGDGMTLPSDELERLAQSEHARWVRDLVADGWKWGPGSKDPARKVHPLLVPWNELAELEREKDREAILALPKTLATVGYAIEFPSQHEHADG